jgi:Spx/MgsR family transcriptional regulator
MSYLDGKDADLVKHDLARERPSRELLERLIDEDNLRDFMNVRSPMYKEMGLAERKLTKSQAIDLMLEEPNLMRRPLLVRGNQAVFGFDAERYDEILRRR